MSRMTKFLRQTCLVQPYLFEELVESELKGSVLSINLEGIKVEYKEGTLAICDAEGTTLPSSNSKPLVNDFGEIQYMPPIQCKCRRETSYQDVQTSNGSIVRSTTRYFLDSDIEIKPDYLIDGSVVLTVHSYVNQQGNVEGYEVYV